MDLDALFRRSPLAGTPLSVIVRCIAMDATDRNAIAASNAQLLSRVGRDGEILLLADRESVPTPIFAVVRGIRVRLLHHPSPESGLALQSAIGNCRYEAILCLDASVPLAEAELRQMLAALEHADIVSGRRSRGIFSRSTDWLFRGIFSAAVSDPLCPVKLMRKTAVRDIELSLANAAVYFEIIAKSTFRTALLDEIDLGKAGSAPGLPLSLLREGAAFWKLAAFPSFGPCVDLRPAAAFMERTAPTGSWLPVRSSAPYSSMPYSRSLTALTRRESIGLGGKRAGRAISRA